MASARQKKVGSAFKRVRSACIKDSSSARALDSCMSKGLKAEIKKIDGPKRKRTKKKRRR